METELLKAFDSIRIQTGVAYVRKYIDWGIGLLVRKFGSVRGLPISSASWCDEKRLSD
ncbi:hypothetical protein [Peribacillus aracenensis]|uniref:hypothetical protein n=1 Tax=Peribacillus aracenensis TaxID=2976708 RepID=UPI0021A4F6D9|nr:hypothetical protein [Peribacillus sp. BBB004]